MNRKLLHMISVILLVIGGLNWGIYGLFGVDVVESLFGSIVVNNTPVISATIYSLVGVATVYLMVVHARDWKEYSSGK